MAAAPLAVLCSTIPLTIEILNKYHFLIFYVFKVFFGYFFTSPLFWGKIGKFHFRPKGTFICNIQSMFEVELELPSNILWKRAGIVKQYKF